MESYSFEGASRRYCSALEEWCGRCLRLSLSLAKVRRPRRDELDAQLSAIVSYPRFPASGIGGRLLIFAFRVSGDFTDDSIKFDLLSNQRALT